MACERIFVRPVVGVIEGLELGLEVFLVFDPHGAASASRVCSFHKTVVSFQFVPCCRQSEVSLETFGKTTLRVNQRLAGVGCFAEGVPARCASTRGGTNAFRRGIYGNLAAIGIQVVVNIFDDNFERHGRLQTGGCPLKPVAG